MIVYFIAPNELGIVEFNQRFDTRWIFSGHVRSCISKDKDAAWTHYLSLIHPLRGVSRTTQACSLERVS